MYLLLIISFTAIFISCYILTKLFFNNRGSALLLLISGLLYLLPTIAGALGILQPYVLITFALITLLISVLIYISKWERHDKFNIFNYLPIRYCARPVILEILLVVVPVICALSWTLIFVVQSVTHKITLHYIPPFPWDVVEYHFPNLVSAIQSGSLWTTLSIWVHYPMGSEMVHSWGFLFLRNDALVYLTHFSFSIIFIFFSCFILHILCFQDRKTISGTEIIAYLIITVLLLLLPPFWDMHFNQIGKNDIAMSAFIMAALCFLLQCIMDNPKNETFGQNLLLLGMALGIASGIKPNGLLYSALFLGILAKDSFSKKVPWHSVGIVCLCILLLAGFWYLRPLIMLGTIPPTGVGQTVVYNLKKGLPLFLNGRENILFSLSIVFCLIMGVIWHKKDFRIRVANYTLAASIVIFCLTPYSVFNKTDIQLRLAPAIIPLCIIISLATFLHLMVPAGGGHQAYRVKTANSGTYRRAIIWAGIAIGLFSLAIVAVSFFGGLATKPRWAWNLRGLIIIGFLTASLSIYNAVKALKEYQLSISRSLLYMTAFFIVVITLVIQIIAYKPPGDLVGYNEQTSAYRWIYKNIRSKTIYALGLRPYGLYGKDLANKVIYDGYSSDMKFEYLLSMIKQEKPGYLVIGRDFAQHPGWYDFSPFPGDVAKILAMPNVFKLEWSDSHAMIFKIEPSFYFHSPPIN
jgi:hypothetical protein